MPKMDTVKTKSESISFPKSKRFGPTSAIGMKNDTQTDNKVPGPKYLPTAVGKNCQLELQCNTPPKHSFGSKGCENRSGFVFGQVKNDMLYSAKPATSDNNVEVSPVTYIVNHNPILDAAPRPAWPHADRFKNQEKIFISKKHNTSSIGSSSPGPMYNPKNHTLALRKRMAQVQPGQWVPN
jgi:hypothetical protein